MNSNLNEKFEQLIDDVQVLMDDVNIQVKAFLEENDELKKTHSLELYVLNSSNKTLVTQVEEQSCRIQELETSLTDQQHNSDVLVEQVVDLQSDLSSQRQEVDKLKLDMTSLRSEKEYLQNKIQDQEGEIINLTSDKESLKLKVNKLEEIEAILVDEKNILQNKIQDQKKDIAELVSSKDYFENELKLVQDKYTQLSEIKENSHETIILRKQLEDIKQQNTKLQDQFVESTVILNNKLSALELKCKTLRSDKEILQKELDKKNELIDNHKRKHFFFL